MCSMVDVAKEIENFMNLADNWLVVFEPSTSILTISKQSEVNLKLAVLVQSLEQSPVSTKNTSSPKT